MRSGKRGSIIACAVALAMWLVFDGCRKKSIDARKATIHFQSCDGTAFQNRWVLPVHALSIDSGWWFRAESMPSQDTLFTDGSGALVLDFEVKEDLSGFVCEPLLPGTPPYFIRLPNQWSENQALILKLPSPFWIEFIGNREGVSPAPVRWVSPASGNYVPDTAFWFSPGGPPRPALVLIQWVPECGNLSITRTFQIHDASGALLHSFDVHFSPEQFGDTLLQSIL